MKKYNWKFSIAGRKDLFTVTSPFSILDPQMKKVLRWKIAKTLKKSDLPLHSTLVVKNSKGILICGASGSGKSTLSESFKSMGYQILANDFVIAWIENNKLVAGSLDYQEKNISKNFIEIEKCYFLDPADSRDIFRMNMSEMKEFYSKIMRPWNKSTCNQFTDNDVFKTIWEKHICLGNRQTLKRWQSAISWESINKKFSSVGIVGLGSVGQDVANLVVGNSKIKTINLFSRNIEKIKSVALDLRSVNPDLHIRVCHDIKVCVQSSDVLVFSFRSDNQDVLTNIQDRYKRINDHIKIIWKYSRVIRAVKFKGIILVVSNPVDLLSWFTYLFSNVSSRHVFDWKGLFSNQIYGIGLGLDYFRLMALQRNDIEIVGEHGKNRWLCNKNKLELKLYENKSLADKIDAYPTNIRKGIERVRFGPSHQTVNIIVAMFENSNVDLRLSTVSKNKGFWGQPLRFKNRIPMQIYDFDAGLKQAINKFEKYETKMVSDSGYF